MGIQPAEVVLGPRSRRRGPPQRRLEEGQRLQKTNFVQKAESPGGVEVITLFCGGDYAY